MSKSKYYFTAHMKGFTYILYSLVLKVSFLRIFHGIISVSSNSTRDKNSQGELHTKEDKKPRFQPGTQLDPPETCV